MLLPNDRCDLHIHTTRSDGRFAPGIILERAARSGLSLIALTDHDIPFQLQTQQVSVEGRKIWVVAAAEISVSHEGYEYHLLAYFPKEVPKAFKDFCTLQCQQRAVRYQEARQKLGPNGIPDSDELARSGQRALTRLHLARALVDSGRAKNIQAAFKTFLNRDREIVPIIGPSCIETIHFIRSLGGLVSWAHPPESALKKHVALFAEAGLNGIEGYRPRISKSQQKTCKKLALKHDLFLTGGSDWHGWTNPNDLGLFTLSASQLDGFIQALKLAA
jgi:predicted metal-dependent phosphoesterase TrpH